MSATDIIGTIKKVTLDGTTFDCHADTNIKEVGSQYENTATQTSGRVLRKMTKRVQSREGVTLVCNGAEREVLQELADRTDNFPMSYETANGDVFRAVGFIDFESRETEENRANVTMHPIEGWEAFLA